MKNKTARLGFLFCLFFSIAFGLGYPVLNRFDPREVPGLSDVKTYAALVTGASTVDAGHVRFRVLVPWIAKPFYLLARGRVGSWDAAMFGLLTADSFLVSGTAVLIVVLGDFLACGTGGSALGLVGALLYLANFAVPNLRLVGLVDAGEGFLLLALIWCLSKPALWMLPAIGVLGALAKESFIPFSIVLTALWWLTTWRPDPTGNPTGGENGARKSSVDAMWIFTAWALSIGTMIAVQWSIAGRFVNPMEFGLALRRGNHYLGHFAASVFDRNLWYIFGWLLPTAIPDLKRLPRYWLIPVAVACVMAFVLNSYFGGAPGTVGRALFSIAGPMLSLSSAAFLLRITNSRS